jgi:alkylated DNA repair dioxygenase AlkB
MESKGLYYFKKLNLGDDLLKKLDTESWKKVVPTAKNSRLVQHYGYHYDYKSNGTTKKANDMPDYIVELKNLLISKCNELNLFTESQFTFNQCIINNYYVGEGISSHIDHSSFGPIIGCFTINSGCNMVFKNGKEIYNLYVEPNSLYIMTGESRYKWTHCMEKRSKDIVDDKIIERDRRVSITFRCVKD